MKRFCFSMFLAMGLVAMAGMPVWAHGGGGGGGGHGGGGHSGGGEHHSEGEHHSAGKEGSKEGGKGKEGKEGEHHGEPHNNSAHHEGPSGQHHGEPANKGNPQHTSGQPGNHNAANHNGANHNANNRSLSPEQRQNLNNRLNAAHNHPNADANRGDRHGDHHDWANNVRDNFHHNYHDYNHWFGGDWWAGHPGAYAGWYNRFGGDHPWSYWWGVPAWGGLTDWMGGEWSQPANYGYGDNVTYQDDSVNVNGQPVASAQDYNQSAFDLAAQTPPAPQPGDNASPAGAKLMPLGVFALSTNQQDQNPTRVLQLAAGKDGTLAGTFFNKAADTVLPVQGTIDRATQRVCFTIGDDKQTVLETGLYNLTQKDAPVLIHQGNSKQETGQLVRLTQPSSNAPVTAAPASNSLGVKN